MLLIFLILFPAVSVDAADGYYTVRSRQELIDLVTLQSETLQPMVKVRIPNYSEAEYRVDFTEFLPIQQSKMNGTLRGTTAELTYEFTYTQAERVLCFLSGGVIELDEKEIKTAHTALAVYYAVINEDMTDFEKQLAIHDYLVVNVDYDYSTSGSPVSLLGESGLPGDVFTPYGALVNRLAVCQGYTEAARILLSLAGIWNDTLIGTANGQNHMWNVVSLDGQMYHMDVTWDDGNVFADGSEAVSHAFLNMTDEQMDVSHDWDTAYQLARFGAGCTATDYNYLMRNGLAVTGSEEYGRLVAEKYRSGKRLIEVLFIGADISEANMLDVLEAAGSDGYTGFSIYEANVLLMRFR